MITDLTTSEVAKAVEEGFSKTPKQLPSWMFYDETGDKIFQAIMHMPEYYLTGCEYEVLATSKEAFKKRFADDGSYFDLVEFGAGDGLKTELLLKHFVEHETNFSYLPVDVSQHILTQLSARLQSTLPELKVQSINKRYEEAVQYLYEENSNRKVYLFLGANIGNFKVADAERFVSVISNGMNFGDQLMIGFDLKKDPHKILAAYNDAQGITRDFNKNLLVRINRELGANFQPDKFTHYPTYDPETGTTKSYLVSLHDQQVFIEALNRDIQFKRWEFIHTEISQKYDVPMIEHLAAKAGLTIVDYYMDRKHYFCDVLLVKRR